MSPRKYHSRLTRLLQGFYTARPIRKLGLPYFRTKHTLYYQPIHIYLVAHSATQYKGLSVCVSVCLSVCLYVPPFQINCFGLKNDSFEFLMASIGFHMVFQGSISFHVHEIFFLTKKYFFLSNVKVNFFKY